MKGFGLLGGRRLGRNASVRLSGMFVGRFLEFCGELFSWQPHCTCRASSGISRFRQTLLSEGLSAMEMRRQIDRGVEQTPQKDQKD